MKNIIKVLYWITTIGYVSLIPSYIVTSPDYMAWWFYLSVIMAFGGAILLVSIVFYRILLSYL